VTKTRRLSDASLVRRSQQGDRRAFGALVGRYDWRLRGLAHALLLDPAEMDSALRLAYLRGWRDVVRLRANDDAARWLYRITYNACIDLLRRDDTQPAAATDLPGSAGGSRRAALLRGLAALAAADRVAVVLVDREGFSPTAAARILGLAPDVLHVRLTAARAELAARLDVPTVAPADDEPDGAASPPGDEPNEPTSSGKDAEPAESPISDGVTVGNGRDAPGSDEPNEPTAGASSEGALTAARAVPEVSTDGNGATLPATEGSDADGTDGREPEVGAAVDADLGGDVHDVPEGDGERAGGGRARRGRRAPKHARRSAGPDLDRPDLDRPVPGTPP
jgi:RNA polymerase sigma-70 factor (ECF subfamily)